MNRASRRLGAALTVLAFAATLAACGATVDAMPSSPAPSTATPKPAASESPSPTPSAEALELTCDSFVAADVVASFTSAGWTGARWGDGPWTIGDQPLEDGLACIWALDHSVGTDDFSWFGWSPLDAAQADAAIAALVGMEFTVDETPDGRYLSENPNFAMTVDENGYGTTYLFADGWVAGAGTRSEIALVRVPDGWRP